MSLTSRAERSVFDTAAAAIYLGVSASFLEKLRMTPARSPRFLRIGRKIVYKIADLEAWANARACGGPQ